MDKDEPAYMLAARWAVRDGVSSSPTVVKALLERIDRMEREISALEAERSV